MKNLILNFIFCTMAFFSMSQEKNNFNKVNIIQKSPDFDMSKLDYVDLSTLEAYRDIENVITILIWNNDENITFSLDPAKMVMIETALDNFIAFKDKIKTATGLDTSSNTLFEFTLDEESKMLIVK